MCRGTRLHVWLLLGCPSQRYSSRGLGCGAVPGPTQATPPPLSLFKWSYFFVSDDDPPSPPPGSAKANVCSQPILKLVIDFTLLKILPARGASHCCICVGECHRSDYLRLELSLARHPPTAPSWLPRHRCCFSPPATALASPKRSEETTTSRKKQEYEYTCLRDCSLQRRPDPFLASSTVS